MINYDSILSVFDGKPTLLQWLKLVKKALDESVLKDITLKQDGANVVFTFNFEDGTSISTPAVTLPKGDTGAKGDKGDKGEQGVSVTGVDEVSNEVVGGQTLTTLRFNFSNGTNNEVVVHAENGKDASGEKVYLHAVKVKSSGVYGVPTFDFKFISTSNTPITKDNITTNTKPAFDMFLSGDDATVPPVIYIARSFSATSDHVQVTYLKTYPTSSTSSINIGTGGNYSVQDAVTEL